MEYWYYEMHTDNVKIGFRVREEMAHRKSRYQEIYVLDTYEYGRILVIDGTVQLTERDEFIYHEMITHVPLLSHENPRKILIIGGGDGGVAREVLKHNPESIDIVDIDEEVVKISREYLPFVSSSYNDNRVHIHIGDGIEFVRNRRGFGYNAVIVDSTDPIGPAKSLFKEDFYRDVKKVIEPNGIFVQQCGSPIYHPEELCNSYNLLSGIFKNVKIYLAYIPTYPSGMWSFVIGSDVDIRMRRRADFETRYFNEDIYESSMALPNFIKEKCKH